MHNGVFEMDTMFKFSEHHGPNSSATYSFCCWYLSWQSLPEPVEKSVRKPHSTKAMNLPDVVCYMLLHVSCDRHLNQSTWKDLSWDSSSESRQSFDH